MAKVNYVSCTSCHKEYYVDRILSDALIENPDLKLKCPFCRTEFQLEKPGASRGAKAAAASTAPAR